MTDTTDFGKRIGNLSILGEESEDEGREDEIKELLAHAFSSETFADEDDDIENEHVNGGSGGSFESKDDEGDTGVERDVDSNSIFHRTHCPSNVGNGDGDRNGNYENSWNSSLGKGTKQDLDEMRTLIEFKERQLHRAEEKIETLNKEKRVLAHQVALLRTEALTMKNSEEELQKSFQLKEDECQFLKEKIQQILAEFDAGKKSESETKDRNFQLESQVEKLQQEIKLLSAIGLSTKEAEINDILRETRQKHSSELSVWRNKVAQLEDCIAKLESQKHSEKSVVNAVTIQTEECQTDLTCAMMDAEQLRFKTHFEFVLNELDVWKQSCTHLEKQLDEANEKVAVGSSKSTVDASNSTESIKSLKPTLTDSNTQTEETMEMYKLLGTLMESWSEELKEANEKLLQKEQEIMQLGLGFHILSEDFKKLKRLVTFCRKEWKDREIKLRCLLEVSHERRILVMTAISKAIRSFEEKRSKKYPEIE